MCYARLYHAVSRLPLELDFKTWPSVWWVQEALLELPREASFATSNPTFEGVCMGNRYVRSNNNSGMIYIVVFMI